MGTNLEQVKTEAVKQSVALQSAADCTFTDSDLIVTDPPYNIGYKYSGQFIDNMPLDKYQELFEPMKGHRVVMIHYIENIVRDIVPVLGNPERVAAWTYHSNTGSRSWRAVCWWNCEPDWEKVRVPYRNPEDKRVQELMLRTGGRALPDVWEIEQVKNVSEEKVKEYTNQIPLKVIHQIIETTAQEGDCICDPFCGTGTTLMAAKQLGFNARGSDINELAVKLTNKRIQSIMF